MQRVTEPELMLDYQQVKAYAEADFSSSDEKMIGRLEQYLLTIGKSINSGSLIIDIGCGPGNITERLAKKWPFATIIGFDGSEEMLKVARLRKNKSEFLRDLKGLIYMKRNLSSSSSTVSSFTKSADLIISNSVLHHIHNPNLFWNAIKNLGEEGTVIFQKDLRRPISLEHAKNLPMKYEANMPDILKRDYMASLKASFTVSEVQVQLKSAGLSQLKVFELDDRYLEITGVL